MGDEPAVTAPTRLTIEVAEAAEILKCTPARVEEMVRGYEIHGIKAGRSWVIPRARPL